MHKNTCYVHIYSWTTCNIVQDCSSQGACYMGTVLYIYIYIYIPPHTVLISYFSVILNDSIFILEVMKNYRVKISRYAIIIMCIEICCVNGIYRPRLESSSDIVPLESVAYFVIIQNDLVAFLLSRKK